MIKDNSKDKLQQIFERQLEFDTFVHDLRKNHDKDMDTRLQKLAMALMVETVEMVTETNYKWWKNPKDINKEAIQEELVDILHFFVSMCLATGMDSDQLYNLYMKKNEENFDRQTGKSKKLGYKIEN
ncbi:MAG: dUTPase [Firmicutes bacterium]|nr:dUTPase [Bacillota bacterium]MCL1954276.1 dUTPase [Bacillota bacterium]